MRLFFNLLFRLCSWLSLKNVKNETHVKTIINYMYSNSAMYDSILKQRVVVTGVEIYGEYHYRVDLMPLRLVGFITKHYSEYSLQSNEIPNRLKAIVRL